MNVNVMKYLYKSTLKKIKTINESKNFIVIRKNIYNFENTILKKILKKFLLLAWNT